MLLGTARPATDGFRASTKNLESVGERRRGVNESLGEEIARFGTAPIAQFWRDLRRGYPQSSCACAGGARPTR